MLIAEYDYATDIAVQKQEAWDEAWKQASEETWDKAWKQASEETWDKAWDKASKELPEKTLKQTALNLLKAGVDVSIIASSTGLSPEVIRGLQRKP